MVGWWDDGFPCLPLSLTRTHTHAASATRGFIRTARDEGVEAAREQVRLKRAADVVFEYHLALTVGRNNHLKSGSSWKRCRVNWPSWM